MHPIDLSGARARLIPALVRENREPRDDGADDCECFDPTPTPAHHHTRDCKSDGHYRCAECARFDLRVLEWVNG